MATAADCMRMLNQSCSLLIPDQETGTSMAFPVVPEYCSDCRDPIDTTTFGQRCHTFSMGARRLSFLVSGFTAKRSGRAMGWTSGNGLPVTLRCTTYECETVCTRVLPFGETMGHLTLVEVAALLEFP